jgi:hypothetical protein
MESYDVEVERALIQGKDPQEHIADLTTDNRKAFKVLFARYGVIDAIFPDMMRVIRLCEDEASVLRVGRIAKIAIRECWS